jgi:sugar/nucleoside kinase (ribokinase family)
MEKTEAILCIGAIIADIVCELPRLPASGDGLVVSSNRMSLGGCAFNNANVIRQLGGEVQLFAPLGAGLFASFVRQELNRVGLRGLEVEAQLDSGVCICLVEPSGERTMFTLPGIERKYEPAWFDALDPANYSAALVGGYEINGAGGAAIIAFLEANPQIRCYFAPGPTAATIDADKIARLNALTPIWHLNKREALAYSGRDALMEAGWLIAAQSGNAVVISTGADGAELFVDGCDSPQIDGKTSSRKAPQTGRQHLRVPSQPLSAVDTIGAGDAHLGALALARSCGYSWKAALELANRVAALVCLQAGPTLPDDALRALRVRA